MIKKLIIITNLLLLYTAILDLPPEAWAGMTGSSYSVPSAVIAGGGIPASSTNFQMDSTMGQPSPLPEQIPSITGTFDLYPGFWQTLTDLCLGNPACMDAQFTYEADATISGQVHFDGSASICPDGGSCTYDWDFGDGNTGTDLLLSYTYTDIPTCEDLLGGDGIAETCLGGPNDGGACTSASVTSDCGYSVTLTLTDTSSGYFDTNTQPVLPVLRIAQLFTTVTHTITQDEDPAPPIYTTVDCDITMTNPPKAVYFFWDDRSFSIKGPTSFVDNGDGTWSLNVQKIYTDDAPANYFVRYYIFDNFQQFDIGYFVVPVSAP